jgi:hypothetical protein
LNQLSSFFISSTGKLRLIFDFLTVAIASKPAFEECGTSVAFAAGATAMD